MEHREDTPHRKTRRENVTERLAAAVHEDAHTLEDRSDARARAVRGVRSQVQSIAQKNAANGDGTGAGVEQRVAVYSLPTTTERSASTRAAICAREGGVWCSGRGVCQPATRTMCVRKRRATRQIRFAGGVVVVHKRKCWAHALAVAAEIR
eukprot:5289557-Pleurochrysis_carterae.AAC.1